MNFLIECFPLLAGAITGLLATGKLKAPVLILLTLIIVSVSRITGELSGMIFFDAGMALLGFYVITAMKPVFFKK
jgi:hypothetical protein